MRFSGMKRMGVALLLGLAALNFVAYRQAGAFTHFAPPGRRTPSPQMLSLGQKMQVLVKGVEVPRPENRRTPRDLGLEFERHVFRGSRGVALEAWLVPQADAPGTVILFHGHAASKDSQLREASVFYRMGYNAFLVDFHGSGGSGGNETSIGFYEAVDVARAFDHVRSLPRAGFCPGVGHDSCLRRRPDEWKSAVSEFLNQVLGASASGIRASGSS